MVKLEDYTSTELKKMISSFNKLVKFSAYSKLKKAELINMIRTHPKIKVEEGANAVKLSIKTDETFLKKSLDQKKKETKEKVKKEVKKEVEKLDDVQVVVKPLTVTKADGTKKELKMKPKKPEPKKPEPKEDKEKAVDNLLKQIKKSYEKNKPKLDKMTDTKYRDVFNKKLNDLYDDVEDIYQADLTTTQKFNLRKRFSEIIPFKKEEPKKPEPKKPEPKKPEPKKPEPKKPEKEDLLTLMDKFNKKYNAVEIKKQNLNKSNLKKFTDPYFKELEKIEKELENVGDSIEFLKTNKKISSDFADIKKNFVRRVKVQMKKN